MQEKIYFFTEDTSFVLRSKALFRKWIAAAAAKEGFALSSLNYIFCSDQYLRRINIERLSHRTYTDIITFELSDAKKIIEGEIYISIDRVKENASIYNVTLYNELKRVMIHGVLHLCGYDDKTEPGRKKMRARENYYIERSF